MPGDRVTAGAYVLSDHDRWLIADALFDVLDDLIEQEARADCARLINFLAPYGWMMGRDWPR